MNETQLSARARRLLQRLREGAFYPAYAPDQPKAMAELEAAGLVKKMGRIKIVAAYWVPKDSIPPISEVIK